MTGVQTCALPILFLWPNTASDKPQSIKVCDSSKKLLLNNTNYVFVKRFTTKEEKRRIQCSMYFGLEYNTEKIGVENHLNYIKKISGILTEQEVYGIFTILNSTFVDRYFRILNGSTQVNANEMNAMPLPDKNAIVEIGYKASKLLSLTPEICDRIICEYFNTDYILQVV